MTKLLKTPLSIGRLALRNRLVLPPMATEKSDARGFVTDALCAHYAEKTRGGHIGLVVAEHCFIRPDGRASRRQLSIAEDACIPGLARLVETLHRNDTPVFAQISHAGMKARQEITGLPSAGPSAVALPNGPQDLPLPHALSENEIGEIRASFVAAARRAKAAGFDGVELHCAHGYLLNQFLSPLSNHRTDRYGGALENRTRLHLETIAEIRSTLGPDYPIALRIGASDYMPGGVTIEDSATACFAFVRAGVNLIDVSGGFCGYKWPDETQQGFFAPLSAAIRERTKAPVILTGGIVEACAAEALLRANKADLIGVGRAILMDSAWPQRAMEGED